MSLYSMTVISASPTPIDDDQRPTPFSVESSRSCTTDSTSSIVTPSIASDDDTIILSMSTTVEDGAQVSIGGSEAEAEFTLPRRARVPSLKQLSDRLQPLSSPPSTVSNDLPSSMPFSQEHPSASLLTVVAPSSSSSPQTVVLEHSTPPKMKAMMNVERSGTSNVQDPTFLLSPSSRLKLPPSAITRSQSHSPKSSVKSTASDSLFQTLFSPEKERARQTPRPIAATETEGSSSTSGSGLKRSASTDFFIKGYREFPSLATIRDRVSVFKSSGKSTAQELKKARQAEVDKENMSPNKGETPARDPLSRESSYAAEMPPPDRPKPAETAAPLAHPTPFSSSSKSGHPLQQAWTIYYDSKTYIPDVKFSAAKEGGGTSGMYEKSLLVVGKLETVEDFARHFNNIKLPSKLPKGSNYHMFKRGIKPMWEDPACAKGGKWVLVVKSSSDLFDLCWANLVMGLIGDMVDPDDETCGIVASMKPSMNRLQIWTRGIDNVEALNALGRRIIATLNLDKSEMEFLHMEFLYHSTSVNPPPGAFLRVVSAGPQRSSTASTPLTSSSLNVFNGGTLPSRQSQSFRPPTPSKLHLSVSPTSPTSYIPGKLQAHPSLPKIPRPGNMSRTSSVTSSDGRLSPNPLSLSQSGRASSTMFGVSGGMGMGMGGGMGERRNSGEATKLGVPRMSMSRRTSATDVFNGPMGSIGKN